MTDARTYGLFEAIGVEIEYMVVDRESLDVRPLADRVLEAAAGEIVDETAQGRLSWSNELVLHVLELKTNGPAPGLDGLSDAFAADVRRIDGFLEAHGARLMPTAMHPWMDPLRETVLWPHHHSAVYRAFDRIFGCRGHGWSNLQSVHLNLPFRGDDEFGRLHAAIRLVLPILPALAASSPFVEGRATGLLDSRMEAYRTNSRMLPSVAGVVVPEAVFTREAYEREILEPMYRDVAASDPEGILQDEFLNARGAIARFGRGTVEIRVLDSQESPTADLAVASIALAAIRRLAHGGASPLVAQQAMHEHALSRILLRTIRDADRATIDDLAYLEALGEPPRPRDAGSLWHSLVERCIEDGLLPREETRDSARVQIATGPLARRLVEAVGPQPSHPRLAEIYREVCDCLAADRRFRA